MDLNFLQAQQIGYQRVEDMYSARLTATLGTSTGTELQNPGIVADMMVDDIVRSQGAWSVVGFQLESYASKLLAEIQTGRELGER